MKNNADLVRQCIDLFNRHDVAAAADFLVDGLVNHCAIPEAQGRSGLFEIWEKLWVAFPDLTWTCEDLIAEGDRVACRVRMRGTNSGPLRFARMPLAATGKVFDGEAIYIFRLAAGKITEIWSQRDEIGMLRQLGQFPLAPSQAERRIRNEP